MDDERDMTEDERREARATLERAMLQIPRFNRQMFWFVEIGSQKFTRAQKRRSQKYKAPKSGIKQSHKKTLYSFVKRFYKKF